MVFRQGLKSNVRATFAVATTLALGFGSLAGRSVAQTGASVSFVPGTVSTYISSTNGIPNTTVPEGPQSAPASVTAAVFDESGNLYVADLATATVYQVKPSSTPTATMYAGTGAAGAPSAGKATSVSLAAPTSLAVDARGNLYIADVGFNVIEKVDTSGNLTIIAGSAMGESGFDGDGGPATSASLAQPAGVAIDPTGEIFIADSGNDVIRKMTTDGNIHTLVGSDGQSGCASTTETGSGLLTGILNTPTGVVIDPLGKNLYISDSATNVILQLNLAAGSIQVIAGKCPSSSGSNAGHKDGAATSAEFQLPVGLGLDAAGDLYIADAGNSDVREISLVDTCLSSSGNACQVITVAGSQTAGNSGDGRPATSAQFNDPADVAVDASGNLYIADSGNAAVRKVGPGAPLTFGNLNLATAQTTTQTITLLNSGSVTLSQALTIATASGSGSNDFVFASSLPNGVTGTACVATDLALAPGTGCVLAVTYQPTNVPAGTTVHSTGSVTITLNGVVQTISLTGSATAAPASLIATTTAVTAAGSFAEGSSITFTATVTATSAGASSPTGTVTFSIDGGTAQASTTALVFSGLTGTATFTLPNGFSDGNPHTVTAVYSGDGLYGTSSGSTSITAGVPGFTASVTNLDVTVSQGSAATLTITFTPTYGYTGTLGLAAIPDCLGANSNSNCTFSPSSITFNGTAAIPVVMTIQTNVSSSASTGYLPGPIDGRLSPIFAAGIAAPFDRNGNIRTGAAYLGLVALLVGMVGLIRQRRVTREWTKARILGSLLLPVLLIGGICSMMAGCGSSGPKTSPGTYNVTLNFSAGSGAGAVTETLKIAVTVQ